MEEILIGHIVRPAIKICTIPVIQNHFMAKICFYNKIMMHCYQLLLKIILQNMAPFYKENIDFNLLVDTWRAC